MKTILLSCWMTALSYLSYGQNLNEWFRQKKTQTRYLLEHLAAQRIYLEYVKKGYKICYGGLVMEGSLKRGELLGHSAFFASLQKASPLVKKSPALQEILQLQRSICGKVESSKDFLGAGDGLTPSQRQFAIRISTNMLLESGQILDELAEILFSDNLQMDDAQRLQEIHKLRRELLDRFLFYKSFTSDLSLLAKAGRFQKAQLERRKKIHGQKGAQR